ncbi:MAG: hypothetical protein SVZ03_09865 [Spirochaetota bacterium]|nr:hypothetical protein [Spirochaetota bacterium]
MKSSNQNNDNNDNNKWIIISPSMYILIISLFIMILLYSISIFFSKDMNQFLKLYRVPTFEESLIYYQMSYVHNSNEYNDVIFLGESACLSGIITRQFEKKTNLKAYNLGTLGWLGPDGYIDILKSYIENHHEPKIIVFAVFPPLLADEKSKNPEIKKRFIRSFGGDIKTSMLNSSIPPQYLVREGIRTIFGKIQGGADYYFNVNRYHRPSHFDMSRSILEQRGFQEDIRRKTIKPIEKKAFIVSKKYKKNIFDMALLARKKNVILMIRLMPIPFQENYIDATPLIQYLKVIEKEFSNVIIDKPIILHYNTKLYAKITHLNIYGARKFTNYLSKRISKIIK